MQSAISTVRERRPFTIVGAVLALVTLGAFMYVATRSGGGVPTPVSISGGSYAVVVAKHDLPARTAISTDDVELQHWSHPVPGAFTTLDGFPKPLPAGVDATAAPDSRRFTAIDMHKGEPVLSGAVVTAAGDVSGVGSAFLNIPAGFVALTIPTGEQQGVAGYVQPGDYIDVVVAVPGTTGLVTKTLFTDLRVLRVGANNYEVQAGPNGPSLTRAASSNSSLTVLMTPCDSEYMNYLLARSFVMRYELISYKDYPGQAPAPAPCDVSKGGVKWSDVNNRFGVNLPANS